jgi:hypothetical protein
MSVLDSGEKFLASHYRHRFVLFEDGGTGRAIKCFVGLALDISIGTGGVFVTLAANAAHNAWN